MVVAELSTPRRCYSDAVAKSVARVARPLPVRARQSEFGVVEQGTPPGKARNAQKLIKCRRVFRNSES